MPVTRRQKAGHRSWSKTSLASARRRRGDIMNPEKRSALMARIKGKNTQPERAVAEVLRKHRLVFECHVNDLPGRPDMAFRRQRVAVFVDGSFWHGWRFPLWKHKLSPAWREKIMRNRERDEVNFRRLRRMGWIVVRIWEHQVEQDLLGCTRRVLQALKGNKRGGVR